MPHLPQSAPVQLPSLHEPVHSQVQSPDGVEPPPPPPEGLGDGHDVPRNCGTDRLGHVRVRMRRADRAASPASSLARTDNWRTRTLWRPALWSCSCAHAILTSSPCNHHLEAPEDSEAELIQSSLTGERK